MAALVLAVGGELLLQRRELGKGRIWIDRPIALARRRRWWRTRRCEPRSPAMAVAADPSGPPSNLSCCIDLSRPLESLARRLRRLGRLRGASRAPFAFGRCCRCGAPRAHRGNPALALRRPAGRRARAFAARRLAAAASAPCCGASLTAIDGCDRAVARFFVRPAARAPDLDQFRLGLRRRPRRAASARMRRPRRRLIRLPQLRKQRPRQQAMSVAGFADSPLRRLGFVDSGLAAQLQAAANSTARHHRPDRIAPRPGESLAGRRLGHRLLHDAGVLACRCGCFGDIAGLDSQRPARTRSRRR